jgi:hypothetical protein
MVPVITVSGMRIFVLSTGRCGSTTFARACEHLTNYSSAHESIANAMLFDERFRYPDNHIEADNRLSWFLGDLGRRFDGSDCLYVHLTREPEAVAASFRARWDENWAGGIIGAFAQGLLMTAEARPDEEKMAVCRFYVETVNANISEFLRFRPSMNVSLGNVQHDFRLFLNRISAEGDLEAAQNEWAVRRNAS